MNYVMNSCLDQLMLAEDPSALPVAYAPKYFLANLSGIMTYFFERCGSESWQHYVCHSLPSSVQVRSMVWDAGKPDK